MSSHTIILALTSLALACALGCSQPEAQPAAPASIILHVLDDATGEELDRVQLMHGSWLPETRLATPGRTTRQTDWSGSSPVNLGPLAEKLNLDEGTLRVGAAGCAWQHLAIDPDSPADITVRLKPGANLYVDIVPPEHPELLTADGGRWGLHIEAMDAPLAPRSLEVSALSDDQDRYVLEGFVPGRYRAEVHFTRPGQNQVLASWAADLTLNEDARILLHLDEPEEIPRAPLSITVKDMDGWLDGSGSSSMYCTVTSSERPSDESGFLIDSTRTPDGSLLFENSAAPIGHYSVSLTPSFEGVVYYNFEFKFDLGLNGLETEWSLPPSCELTVKVVDSQSKEPLAIETLFFGSTLVPPSYAAWYSTPDGPTELKIKVPLGRTAFEWALDGYGLVHPIQEINAGMTELSLEAAPGIIVPLELDTGGHPADEAFMELLFEAVDIRGPSSAFIGLTEKSAPALIAFRAGTYTLTLEATKNFEAAGPFELLVEEGTNEPFKLKVTLKP